MNFKRCPAVVGFAILAGLLAAFAAAQAPAAPAGTDPAYAAGYVAGYPLGQHDHAAAVAADAHKFSLYQSGTAGYTAAYGSEADYRAAYQSGFGDGYGDGYAGRPIAVSPHPAPADAVQVARANGYHEGYDVGQADANRRAPNAATTSPEYQSAQVGYAAALGATDQYQLNFRSGFVQGYGDGFYHRLYDAQLGVASTLPSPRAAANDLPTTPEQMAGRPSGVYDNGVLLAPGTRLQTSLDGTIDTKVAQVGDAFALTVTVPVWVGAVAAIPAGSVIHGTVQQVTRGGAFSGSAKLQLHYNTITLPGEPPQPLYATTVGAGADAEDMGGVNSNEGTVNGQSPNGGQRAATGAAMGAVFGGIFGGVGGLVRGGVAGAAASTTGVLISHKKDLILNSGEPLSLRLDRPLELPTIGGAR